MIKQPNINISLYNHQLKSVYDMETLEHEKRVVINDNEILNTTVGIQADKTGYGKTLSMLTLCYRDKMEWTDKDFKTISEKHDYDNVPISLEVLTHKISTNVNLILVSKNLLPQWLKEISHFPSMRYIAVDKKSKVIDISDMKLDVCFVTPITYNKFMEANPDKIWKRFIFDEPAHLNVPSMAEFHAGFVWLVTATPDIIHSFHCRKRGYMKNYSKAFRNSFICGSITIKNDEKFLEECFSMPKTHYINYNVTNLLYRKLNGVLSHDDMVLIERGDIKILRERLNLNVTGNILEKLRENLTKELEVSKKIYLLRKEEGERKRIISLTKKLHNLEQNMKEKMEQCGICYGELTTPATHPVCCNTFCLKCIVTWLRQNDSCPYCRQNCTVEDFIVEGKEEKKREKKEDNSPQGTLISILKSKPNGKFIVFTDSCDYQTILRAMYENSINYIQIKGRKEVIQRNLKKFKDDITIKVVFLNASSMGFGLNLQFVSDIIVYHSMKDDLYTQILGRANRLGRREPLTVHQFYHK